MPTLRLLSYNIHHGADARGRPNLPAIADTIARAQPAVVCLQEVDRHYGPRSGNADQVAEFAGRLDMHAHFSPAFIRPDGGEYGNAILSLSPMTSLQTHPLPTMDGIEPRAAASARLDTPAGAVTVISTHLSVGPARRRDRIAQLRALVELISHMEQPVALAADFNTDSPTGELSILDNVVRHARPRRLAPARLATLVGRPVAATYPVSWPMRHIDRVYVTEPARVRSVKALRSRASDHRALMVDIALS